MAEKSRVLLLTTSFRPLVGGSEIAIEEIARRLPDVLFDIVTGLPDQSLPAKERDGNMIVYRVGKDSSRFRFLLPKNFLPLSIFFKARALVQENTYVAVHAYQASQAAGGGWLLKWFYPRLPFIVTVQEGKDLDKQSWLTRLFRRLIFMKADTVTVISNYLARYVRSQNKSVPVVVIPNGVNLRAFQSPGGIVKDGRKIITVSRLVKKNGVLDLIRAMVLVVKKFPDASLQIIGDGDLKDELVTETQSLGLSATVTFLGEIKNTSLPGYLIAATVFVRPSLSEGLGIAFLEAMACGVPIIATPVGGIPDFLKDGETGLFCELENASSIAAAIIHVLEDEPLRRKLSDRGRALVAEKYSWDTLAFEFKKIYAS